MESPVSTASQVATHVPPADPAHPAVGAATSLLDAYAPGDHFLATPGARCSHGARDAKSRTTRDL